MAQDSSDEHCCGHPLRRRSVLQYGAGVVPIALAGCLGGSGGEPPDPVVITADAACDNCGMIISKHPGPNGQLYFTDHEPEKHDPPFWFDSLKMCLFPMLLEAEQMARTTNGVYATDYSRVDYTLRDDGGTTYISSHTEPESFGRAQDLTYVVGSEVEGAMGPDFIPFSKTDDASAFAAEHGGQTVAFEDIDDGMVGK